MQEVTALEQIHTCVALEQPASDSQVGSTIWQVNTAENA